MPTMRQHTAAASAVERSPCCTMQKHLIATGPMRSIAPAKKYEHTATNSNSSSRTRRAAVEGARVVTTDVWASMGQEEETRERLNAFKRFQVDNALFEQSAADSIFLHCLPAHRGEEVTADVIDGPRSKIFDEAENRLHIQKAILAWTMGGVALNR